MICSALFFAASAHAVELKFESTEPFTQIYEIHGDQKKLLGTTPLKVNGDAFQGKVFVAEKTGFVPAYMGLYGSPKSQALIQFSLKRLNDWLPEEMNARIQQASEDLVDQVYLAQSLIEKRDYKSALAMLESLKTHFPQSLSIRILYANSLLLNGDSAKANLIYQSLVSEIPDSRKELKEQIINMGRHFKDFSFKAKPDSKRNPSSAPDEKGGR